MNSYKLFIYFLTVSVTISTTQIAAASEKDASRLEYSANAKILATSVINEAGQSELTQPAEIFVPYLDEIQESLPSDLVLRLPSQIVGNDTLSVVELEDSTYIVRIFSFHSPSSLTIGIYRCDDGSPSCLISSFSVDHQSSTPAQEALQHHQATGIPITLASDIQGYLLEKHQSDSPQSLESVVWEQDGMIYSISSLMPEQHNVIDMAQSMANAAPIGSSVPAHMPPVENQPLLRESELSDVDTDAISVTAGEDLSSSQPFMPINPSSDRTSTIAPSVPSDESLGTSANSTLFPSTELLLAQGQVNDEAPRPLPEELEIDESGGQFPLGVIRPIPVLAFSSNFSIFTNNNLSVTPLTESTAFPISASLQFSPELGDRTRLTASVGGSFTSFTTADDYISLNAGLGILQDLGDQMSLGVGWNYQQIYVDGFNDDLSEHSVQLNWSRVDELVERKLFLDSGYVLSANFAQDDQQSRLVNSAGLGLSYSFTPRFQGRLGYLLVYDSFFESDDALRHQLSGQVSYQINRNLFVGTSISYLFGEQVDLVNLNGTQDVNNVSFGLHFGFNFPLLY